MNEYRVSLWIKKNRGDIPDLYFRFQMNAEASLDDLIVAAMVMARARWVQRAEAEVLVGDYCLSLLVRSGVSLDGVEKMKYCVTRSESGSR